MADKDLIPERTFKIEGTRICQEPPDVKLKEFNLKDPAFEMSLSINVSLRHDFGVDVGKDVFGTSIKLERFSGKNPSDSRYVSQYLEFPSIEEIQNWLWSSQLQKKLCSDLNDHLLLRAILDFGLKVGNLKERIEEDWKKRQCLLATCL